MLAKEEDLKIKRSWWWQGISNKYWKIFWRQVILCL